MPSTIIISERLNLFSLNIYLPFLFFLFSFFVALFVFWYEGRIDGFDELKLLDLFFISFLFSIFISKMFFLFTVSSTISEVFAGFRYYWLEGFNLFGLFLAVYITFYFFTDLWKWSRFRIFDSVSMAFSLSLSIFALGMSLIYKNSSYLVTSFLMFFSYLVSLLLRKYKIASGLAFSVFLFILCLPLMLFFYSMENLIFCLMLITISLVNIYLRYTKYMLKANLPYNLINFFRNKLTLKDKRIKAEQKLLTEEDPYTNKDHGIGNSEEMDEAILEDSTKELVDIKKTGMSNMRIQILKALGKIKIGTYGICEICGLSIDKARLKAYPEATTCITCASKNLRKK